MKSFILFISSSLVQVPNYFFQVSKFASQGTAADSIDLLKNNSSCHNLHTVGIAHTRYVWRIR